MNLWLRTIEIVRKETVQLAARDLLYAPSHRQYTTYSYYTSCGALVAARTINQHHITIK